jgi:nucleoside phosphorylase
MLSFNYVKTLSRKPRAVRLRLAASKLPLFALLLLVPLAEYTSPTRDLGQYAIKKQREYRDSQLLFARYVMVQPAIKGKYLDGLIWVPRIKKSAAGEITTEWVDDLALPTGTLHDIVKARAGPFKSTSRLERRLANVPEALDGRAFLARNVLCLLPKDITSREATATSLLISRAYVTSFIEEFQVAILVDTPIGRLDCDLPSHSVEGRPLFFSYRCGRELLASLGLRRYVDSSVALSHLLELRSDPVFEWLRSLINDEMCGDSRRLSWALAAGKVTVEQLPPKASREVLSAHLHFLYDHTVKYVDNEQAVFPQLFYGDSKKGDDYRIGIGEQISLWPAEPKKSVEDLRKMASIGVITALEKEFAAVKAMLPESVEWTAAGTGAGRRYLLSRVPAASGGDHVVAVALMNDMGNNSAAVRATQLLGHFPKIDHIVMCGIAGGIPTPSMPGKFAHLGDVVVSDQFGLIQYDFLKVAPLEIVVRDRPRPPDAELLEALKYLRVEELEGKRRWETYVANGSVLANGQRPDDGIDASGGPIKYPADPTRTPRMPRLFSGPIASANTLLRDPAKRDELH